MSCSLYTPFFIKWFKDHEYLDLKIEGEYTIRWDFLVLTISDKDDGIFEVNINEKIFIFSSINPDDEIMKNLILYVHIQRWQKMLMGMVDLLKGHCWSRKWNDDNLFVHIYPDEIKMDIGIMTSSNQLWMCNIKMETLQNFKNQIMEYFYIQDMTEALIYALKGETTLHKYERNELLFLKYSLPDNINGEWRFRQIFQVDKVLGFMQDFISNPVQLLKDPEPIIETPIVEYKEMRKKKIKTIQPNVYRRKRYREEYVPITYKSCDI